MTPTLVTPLKITKDNSARKLSWVSDSVKATVSGVAEGERRGTPLSQIFLGNAVPQMTSGQGGTVYSSVPPGMLEKVFFHTVSVFKLFIVVTSRPAIAGKPRYSVY